jgi:hypothetical protein
MVNAIVKKLWHIFDVLELILAIVMHKQQNQHCQTGNLQYLNNITPQKVKHPIHHEHYLKRQYDIGYF